MKLLIVDDEELTRTGVISSLDWSSLGIDEVIQADDGVHGLETARLYKPEIILCDVRMPRMDGITMLERLEKLLPDSVAIFMSGYSDKEAQSSQLHRKTIQSFRNRRRDQRCPGALSTESPFPPRRNAALHGDSLPACPAAHTSIRSKQPDHRRPDF